MTTLTTGPRLVLPRFGTPRNLDRETYGPEVGEVAQRLGRPLMPHQQLVMDVALEVDRESGSLAYDEVDWTIMRQSGKTWGVLAKMVWRCTKAARRLLSPQTVTYTAQTRIMARRKLERDFAEALRSSRSFTEIRNPKARPIKPTEWKASLNNGSEHLHFGRANYLQIDAPSKSAGHGDTLDDGNIDEARFHWDDSVEQSMRPAQATRRDAQLWVLSTSGDERSPYLWRKVLAGRAACESGKPSRVAYFEWSIPPEADIDDEEVWWQFMPALGHTISPEFVRAELERARRNPDEGGEDLWRQEYGNQWIRVPVLDDGERPRIITGALWQSRIDRASEVTGRTVLGVDVAPGGRSAAITVVGRRSDGRAHLETIEPKQHAATGTFWVERRLTDLVAMWGPDAVAVDAGGPAAALLPEIGRAAGTVPVVKISGREYTAACEAFVLAVVDDKVRHLGEDWMEMALDGATKKQRGDGWLWDRQTALSDITPLVAGTVALRALEQLPDPVEPRRPLGAWR